MILKRAIYPLAGALVVLSTGVSSPARAQQVPDVCTVGIARSAISTGRENALCGCTALTRGMVEYVQRRPDFVRLLDGYQDACPGLAMALGDVPTASIRARAPGGSGDRGGSRGSEAGPGGAPTAAGFSTGDSDDGPGGGSDDAGSDPGDDNDTGGGSSFDDGGVSDDTPGDDGGTGTDDPGDDGGTGTDDPGDDGNGAGKGPKGNNGHGNDDDGFDSSNPGRGKGKSSDGSDQDGRSPGRQK